MRMEDFGVNPHAIGYEGVFAKLIGKPSHEFHFFPNWAFDPHKRATNCPNS